MDNVSLNNSYKQDLQRSMFKHAMIPYIISLLVVICVLGVVSSIIIYTRNQRTSNDTVSHLETVVNTYNEKTGDLAETLSIEKFLSDSKYKVEINSRIYDFLNEQQIRGDFYIFDKNYVTLFFTSWDSSDDRDIKTHLRLVDVEKDIIYGPVFDYATSHPGNTGSSKCIYFQSCMTDGEIDGFVGYSISAEKISEDYSSRNISVLITNRFNRLFSGSNSGFAVADGKVRKEFQKNSGLVPIDHSLYYISSVPAFHGDVIVYAITNCTVIQDLLLLLLLFAVFFSLIIIWFIHSSAKKIAENKTKSIYRLIEGLDRLKAGDFDTELVIDADDEFRTIGETVNMMRTGIREMMERHDQLTREKTVAHLRALKFQFSSHFLFNTLTSIQYMIVPDPKKAQEMIVNLSRLLRYSLEPSEGNVLFGRELDCARQYLEIMKCRYPDRLTYDISVEDHLLNVEVPRMLLQPIAENAAKYGLEDGSSLHISVTAMAHDGRLVAQVKDNGRGISEEMQDFLRKNFANEKNTSDHIGLYNVHKRISLTYGEEYGVRIQSEEGNGTCISLVLPVIINE